MSKIKYTLSEATRNALNLFLENRVKIEERTKVYKDKKKNIEADKDIIVKSEDFSKGKNASMNRVAELNQQLDKLYKDFTSDLKDYNKAIADTFATLSNSNLENAYNSYLAKLYNDNNVKGGFAYSNINGKEKTVACNGKSLKTNLKNWLIFLGVRRLDGSNVDDITNFIEALYGAKVVKRGKSFIASISLADFINKSIYGFIEYTLKSEAYIRYNNKLFTPAEAEKVVLSEAIDKKVKETIKADNKKAEAIAKGKKNAPKTKKRTIARNKDIAKNAEKAIAEAEAKKAEAIAKKAEAEKAIAEAKKTA